MKLELIAASSTTVEMSVQIDKDVTVVAAWFMVKVGLTDPDGDALVSKLVEFPSNADGRIVNTGPDAVVQFYINDTDVAALDPFIVYVYASKYLLSNGQTYSPLDGRGTVHVQGAGVQATALP